MMKRPARTNPRAWSRTAGLIGTVLLLLPSAASVRAEDASQIEAGKKAKASTVQV